LGTAAFGLKYGYSKNISQIKSRDIKKILNLADKKGISILDTAFDYGNSQKKLGNLKISRNKKIISKFPKYISKNRNLNFLINIFKKGLKELKQKKIYGLLIHDYKQLLDNDNLIQFLIYLKKKKLVKKIGVSIYSKNDFYSLKNFKDKIDILQIPVNIFDQRFLNPEFLKKIKKRKIEIHARSIFLKGILLKDNFSNIPKYFNKWKSNFDKLQKFNKKHNLNNLETCLLFISRIREIDKFLIGVKSESQLEQILLVSSKKKNYKNISFKKLKINDIGLINPKNWKI